MTTPDLGPILEDLAAGRIDASEAARRIDAAKPKSDAPEPRGEEPTNEELGEADGGRRQYSPYAREVFSQPPEESTDTSAGARRAPGSKGVDRITVRAVGRRVRIAGDPAVATASAEGPHVLRRNGSVLEVSSDGELGPDFDGFSLLRPPRSLDDIRALGLGKELFLRINPRIMLDIEVTAGSLSCVGVPYLGKIRVTAGGAEMAGVKQADDVLVQAGSATLKGSLTTGRSRVRVESGQLTIELDDDSDVTIHGDSQLGRISWSGSSSALDELVLGTGSARLDIGVVMGWANVKSPRVQDNK